MKYAGVTYKVMVPIRTLVNCCNSESIILAAKYKSKITLRKGSFLSLFYFKQIREIVLFKIKKLLHEIL